jgi:hypothetical protein
MLKNHSFLMLLAAAILMAASGAAVIGAGAPVPGPIEAAVLSAPADAPDAAACSDRPSSANDSRTPRNLPGCCSTQCNVDKDCDRICGKGNCACLQQTPCCRRCVY